MRTSTARLISPVWLLPVFALAFLCTVVVGASVSGDRAHAAAGPLTGGNGPIAVSRANPGAMRAGLISRKGSFRTLYRASRDDFVADVSFSPSGSRVAYVYGFQPTRLGITKRLSRRSTTLDLGNWNVRSLTWTKGRKIAISSDFGTKERSPGTYVVRDNGTGFRKLFRRQQEASTANRSFFIHLDEQGNSNFIDLLDHRGKRVRRLDSDRAHFFSNPAFSTDGRWIAYVRMPADPSRNYRGNIFIIRRDGTGRRQLTRGNRDGEPAFSPDGRWIAFDRLRAGQNYYSNISILRVSCPARVRRLSTYPRTTYFDVSWGRR